MFERMTAGLAAMAAALAMCAAPAWSHAQQGEEEAARDDARPSARTAIQRPSIQRPAPRIQERLQRPAVPMRRITRGDYDPEQYAPDRSGPRAVVNFRLPGADRASRIPVQVIDGLLIAEGDIVLGPAPQPHMLMGLQDESGYWPGGVIPYEVASGFSSTMRSRIETGIEWLNTQTNLLLVERTGESDYVRVRTASGCWSRVGMQGGRQDIGLGNCSTGSVAHEFLHAAGFWHEQSRSDRDDHVNILWDNIIDDTDDNCWSCNFNKRDDVGADIGEYDYGSIMHYGHNFFGRTDPDTGQRMTTIETLEPGVTIGQRSQLSPLDIAGVNSVYSAQDCIRFNPSTASVARRQGRWKIVDGSHWVFDFGPGSGDRAEAQRTLQIIQHYGMDQVCFVGRPNPSAQYLLASGQAPRGRMQDEDCLRWNAPEVTHHPQHGWRIVDGNSIRMSFPNYWEAHRTLERIEHHGFNRACYVGRPGPSFRYFRR